MELTYQEYYNQAEVLISIGKYKEAIDHLQKAEALENNHTELYIQQGIAYANLEEIDKAEKVFKKALLADKKNGEAFFHMACVSALKGDFEQAINYGEQAKVNGYNNAQLYFTIGMMYEEQDEVNLALRNYNMALELEPVRADIQLQKCLLLISNNRKEDALEGLDSMIKNCPDYFEGYHYKCSVLTDMGKYEDANDILEKGLELFPEEIGFKVDKAKILIMQNKFDEAIELLKALEANPGEWKRSIYLEIARCYGQKEDVDNVSYYLKKAYDECKNEDGSNDDEITYLLMSVYMNSDKYKEVITMAKELLDETENVTYSNIAQFYIAEAYNHLGMTEEAKREYEATVTKCRNATLANAAALDAYMMRALALSKLGNNDDALEMIDYILAINPDSSEVHAAKAFILKSMGRVEESEAEVKLLETLNEPLGVLFSHL